jgi:hypothetical protein
MWSSRELFWPTLEVQPSTGQAQAMPKLHGKREKAARNGAEKGTRKEKARTRQQGQTRKGPERKTLNAKPSKRH